MKLTSALIARTLDQFDAQPIPEDHPAVAQLNSLFGEHTYFLDGNGLNIIEPTGEANSGAQRAQVIKIAEWKDEERTSLVPHEPELGEVIILRDGGDDAA